MRHLSRIAIYTSLSSKRSGLTSSSIPPPAITPAGHFSKTAPLNQKIRRNNQDPEVQHALPPYIAALPLDSNGMISTSSPETMKSAPLVYTGAAVSRLANMAMMGCHTSQYSL